MKPTPPRWTDAVYQRHSVDIHIPDWHPALLSKFNAVDWVSNMATAGVQSLLQYTNSHVGLCLWRTNVGQRHANMGDRDFFGEVVAECRKHDIHPLAYVSVIHDNWAFEHHPDWRIMQADGYAQLNGRYGTVCPNSPYRDYLTAIVREIASNYAIDGMFFDMTFWPAICYCPHCTARFWSEHHAEPPRIVNWDDPLWRSFQRARERWLLDFAMQATATAKQCRPGITVNHQFSTVFHNWAPAVPLELTQACDYVGGDFYGGPLQHSLACKAYYGLTQSYPFEFHTSRTRLYTDHVTVKPMEEIRTEAFVASLHSAALMLVDYINADGTLNSDVYRFLGELSRQRAIFEPYLGGRLCADIALYFDKNSVYIPDEQNVHVTQLRSVDRCPHREALVGIARILQQEHIPFGVITNITLDQLASYRAVFIPSVLEITVEQAEVFRQFVANGGILIASGKSSLDRFATPAPRFLLEDVYGLKYLGITGTTITYMTPHDAQVRQAVFPQDHLSFAGGMVMTEPHEETTVLAQISLPFIEPEIGRVIGSRFAAIHSNPPAQHPTSYPAITMHTYGKGIAVWMAAPFEATDEYVNSQLIAHLVRRVLPVPFWFEAGTHTSVEVTLFDQPERNRMLLGMLNTQGQLPQIPVGATVRLRCPNGRRITSIEQLPDRSRIEIVALDQYVQFNAAPFDCFCMYLVKTESCS